MAIDRGITDIPDLRRGATLINFVRRGNILVWSRAGASFTINNYETFVNTNMNFTTNPNYQTFVKTNF